MTCMCSMSCNKLILTCSLFFLKLCYCALFCVFLKPGICSVFYAITKINDADEWSNNSMNSCRMDESKKLSMEIIRQHNH